MGVNWKQINGDWRQMQAEEGDYTLLIKGDGKYRFTWAVFFGHQSILSSVEIEPTRNITSAMRLAEAVYFTHLRYS